MTDRAAAAATVALAVLALAVAPFVAYSYSDGPPPAHTGGFGEPTCRACHFGRPLATADTALAIRGLPEHYRPGERYRLTVRLTHPDMQRAGFELAARYAAGKHEGHQAGSLAAPGERAGTVLVESTDVQYARQTLAGTTLTAPNTAAWTIVWTAPDSGAAPVVFHIAANAANYDDSAFGDVIYADSVVIGGVGRP